LKLILETGSYKETADEAVIIGSSDVLASNGNLEKISEVRTVRRE
jgi:hypothetical protein